MRLGPTGRRVAAVGVPAACAATALAAALVLSHSAGERALVASARALMAAIPVAVGLYASRTRSQDRFGLLLIAAGAGMAVTTLAESSHPLPYTVGRATGWMIEPLLVALMLSFPTGRLRSRTDRVLVGATVAVVGLAFLPLLAISRDFDIPSPFTSCTSGCPPNAFFLFGREPALVDTVVRPLGVVLVLVLMLAVIVRLLRRMKRATPLTRRMLGPVVAIQLATAGTVAAGLVVRALTPDAWVLRPVAWLLALSVPAMAVAFLAGLLRWQLLSARALQRLARCARSLPDAATLRRAFAEAFDDPAFEILLPAGRPGEWRDGAGRVVRPRRDQRGVTLVREHGHVVAALVHDEGLSSRPELVEAATALAGVVLGSRRLAAEAQASRSQRRDLERDLHDGAQQRLVALRIELKLAEELVREDPERGALRLGELELELEQALEELRSLARGECPPILAERGLADAVRDLAARSPVPVEVHDQLRTPPPPEVERAIYFCVAEALQNVAKHARGARLARVRLVEDPGGALRFSVADDGAGTEPMVPGIGLRNLRERLAGVGGELDLESAPGAGTTVCGRVPAPVAPEPVEVAA